MPGAAGNVPSDVLTTAARVGAGGRSGLDEDHECLGDDPVVTPLASAAASISIAAMRASMSDVHQHADPSRVLWVDEGVRMFETPRGPKNSSRSVEASQ